MTRTMSAAFAAATLLLVSSAIADESVVNAPTGPIQGIVTDRVRAFRGIPYAAPPVGALRWARTEPAAPWSSTYMALEDGPGCPQDCKLPPHACPPVVSEDCLVLNVFTPRLAELKSPAPVMLFIHGGNFKQGYGGGILYDGTSIANSTGTILVTVNYRLGALGFLNTGNTITGNFGLYDQQEAMRWVQKNIAAFGGDASKVTVFGQSAGAMSTASHLIMPSSEGLFHNALMESEPFGLTFRTNENFANWSFTYATKYGPCNASDTVAAMEDCLRAMDFTDIIASQAASEKDILGMSGNLLNVFLPWTPSVGGTDLPEQPLFAISQGNFHDVPVMIGTVAQEGLLFVDGAFPTPMSDTEYDILLDAIFGDASAIAKQYPAAADARDAVSLVATDALFKCATRNVSLTARKSEIFVYHFDHIMSFGKQVWGPFMTECDNAVCHSGELVYVFYPTLPASWNATYTAAEQVLAKSMESYWANFAATGSPGSAPMADGTSLAWPAFEGIKQQTMTLATPNVVQSMELAKKCAFWEPLGYSWLHKP